MTTSMLYSSLIRIVLGVGYLILCASQPIYPEPLSVRCQQGYCLVLYDYYGNGQGEYLSWYTAVQMCRDEEMSPAFVQSAEAQDLLNTLVNDLPDDTPEDVWLGGHTSQDNTWRYISGTTFTEDMFTHPIIYNANCAFGEVLDDQVMYTKDECRETNGVLGVLCQIPEFLSQGCNDGYSVSGQCLTKENGDGLDWFSTRQLCLQKNGDLPQIVFSDFPDAVEYLGQGYKFWMGIRKSPWTWRTKDYNNVKMYYYNWRPTSSPSDRENNCMAFNRERNGQWTFRNCNGDIKYFICTNSTEYVPITTQTAAPTTSTTHTTTSPSSGSEVTTTPAMGPTVAVRNNTTPESADGSTTETLINPITNNVIYYVIAVVVIVILIAVLVPVIVCVIRRRRENLNTSQRKPGNDSVTVNNRMLPQPPGSEATALDTLPRSVNQTASQPASGVSRTRINSEVALLDPGTSIYQGLYSEISEIPDVAAPKTVTYDDSQYLTPISSPQYISLLPDEPTNSDPQTQIASTYLTTSLPSGSSTTAGRVNNQPQTKRSPLTKK